MNLVGMYVPGHAGCYRIVRVLVGMYMYVFGWYEWSYYVRLVCRFYLYLNSSIKGTSYVVGTCLSMQVVKR